jgi:hypothetical protein
MFFFFSLFLFVSLSMSVHSTGTGESGKSTIFKQMKILQVNGGFSAEEIQSWKAIIHANILSQMKVLAQALKHLNVPLGNPSENTVRVEVEGRKETD